MNIDTRQRGAIGEQRAVEALQEQGYRIVARNVRTRFGEIDIVARDAGTLCFIEVKTRTTDAFGSPAEAVGRVKRHRMTKAALAYMKHMRLTDEPARFDIVSVTHNIQGMPQVDIIANAFDASDRYGY